ncbi:MAG: benzoate-CoA ligase family protein [Planctomycetes bacterium]|nr:benzoate-CoA ligase family protein [Planctomycetota bacterium]
MAIPFPETFNLAEYFLDHNLAARADKVCVHYREETHTYRQIHEGACRVAGALRSLGVRQEDRVLVVLPDSPAFVTALFGVHKAGAVLAMANPMLPADDYRYYVNYTRCPVAIVHHAVARHLEQVLPELRHLKHALVVGGDPGRFLSFERTIAEQPAQCENAPTHRDDPAVWLFTSGTSGKPKAAMHLQHDFAYNTECYAKQTLAMNENDRTLSVPKLFFGYATGTNLWFPFAVGASTVLFEELATPAILFDLIRRFRPTVLTNVPTMINKMLNEPGAERQDLSCVRACLSAGEALPPELYRRWKQTFGVEILDGIGSAEMFHIYISNRFGEVREGSLGKLVPGYEARIVGANGADVPDGEIGTLWVSGDSRMVAYFQDNEKSRATVKGEWVVSGDLFRRDKAGYFWYEGRADDMLKVGGIWVSPGEVENCLLQHAAVKECAVVGWRDEQDLVKPKAFVVLRDGVAANDATSGDLIEFAKARLARYKAPRWIVFMDALPRNDRGKIERKKLQQT